MSRDMHKEEEYNGNLPVVPDQRLPVTRELTVKRPPEIILEEATKAAKALQGVISRKPKKVILNGEQYLEFEDWQTIGRFYGIAAKVVDTRYVEYEDIKGFEARAIAVDADGIEISAAEASCLTDEEKWRSRPKYKTVYILKDGTEAEGEPPKDKITWEEKDGKWFPKKKRVYVGEESVPLFQLKSMAQTRACAKALRNVLAWVVVLAGYRPTPAEELEGQAIVIDANDSTPFIEPQKKNMNKPSEVPQIKDPESPATEAQIKAIHALLRKAGIDDDFEKHKVVSRLAGVPEPEVITSMSLLTKQQASAVIDALNELAEKAKK